MKSKGRTHRRWLHDDRGLKLMTIFSDIFSAALVANKDGGAHSAPLSKWGKQRVTEKGRGKECMRPPKELMHTNLARLFFAFFAPFIYSCLHSLCLSEERWYICLCVVWLWWVVVVAVRYHISSLCMLCGYSYKEASPVFGFRSGGPHFS